MRINTGWLKTETKSTDLSDWSFSGWRLVFLVTTGSDVNVDKVFTSPGSINEQDCSARAVLTEKTQEPAIVRSSLLDSEWETVDEVSLPV